MNTWTSVEHAWGEAALGAMIPATARAPSCADANLSEFWSLFESTAPTLLRWGFRASVWAWVVVVVWMGRTRFSKTSAALREAALIRMNQGPYASRQIAVTLKVIATLAYFTDAEVRHRYEGA